MPTNLPQKSSIPLGKYTVRPMDPMGPGIPQNVWNLEESGHSKLKLHPEMSETGNRSYAEGGALKGMFSSVRFGERNQSGHVVKQFQRHEST